MSSDHRDDKDRVGLEVLQALRALSTEIDRLDALAAERFGLNRTDLRALDLIGSAGTLAPTALARGLGFTTGGVTTVIDRLEAAGYVRREPDPKDRRRLVLHPTGAVAEREAEVFGDLVLETTAVIVTYELTELTAILDFLQRVRDVTAQDADRLSEQAAPGDVEG